jgi:hypothetical protein
MRVPVTGARREQEIGEVHFINAELKGCKYRTKNIYV